MTIRRITARLPPLELPLRTALSVRSPAPGESVRVTLNESPDGGVTAVLPDGVPIRLTGLDWLGGALRPGDVVSLRVVANGPVLELELESAARSLSARADPLNLSDYPAMRLDFAELRNLAWRAPNPVELANAWQVLARASSNQPPPPGPDRWLLPVYGWSGAEWGGLRMNLRLVRRKKDSRSTRHGRPPLALRVELKHPTLGRIEFEVVWHAGAIQLSFAVEESASAQVVRKALPSFIAALLRAELRLANVRLAQGTAALLRGHAPASPLLPEHISDETLPAALFRAAAEITVLLLKLAAERHTLIRENR
jgi:hypothetical protein